VAVKDGFQAGQTAKARRGPPCAVTPYKDMTASNPASLKNSDGEPQPESVKALSECGQIS